jgi:hypothetical protein
MRLIVRLRRMLVFIGSEQVADGGLSERGQIVLVRSTQTSVLRITRQQEVPLSIQD